MKDVFNFFVKMDLWKDKCKKNKDILGSVLKGRNFTRM